ncbi:MAG: hypothetical protein LLG06_16490 [Desulfobacteraceae bacterium]|nr:hypothetical protein [Desulfobacteraceae bacterium]
MKRCDTTMLQIFSYGIPVLVLYGVYAYLYRGSPVDRPETVWRLIYNFGGLILAAWMLLSLYLSLRLMASGGFRDEVLSRMTFIKERDEREIMLTGVAVKKTFLTSLAILIFLFFLSCFHVSLSKLPPGETIDGKTRVLTLDISLNLIRDSGPQDPGATKHAVDIVSYEGLPITSTAVILLLILWQILSYNCAMRRLMREGNAT